MKISVSGGLLLGVHTIGCAGYTSLSYTNQSEVPLYGQSPPIYPSPEGNGHSNSAWSTAYTKARSLLSQLTLEEKVNVTRGFTGNCVGNTGAVTRLGIKPLCLADAPDGIRGQEFVSSFPASIHVAATFDRSLLYQWGRAIGEEYRGKGINIALGPVAGPLGRMARGGRNWEGLSNDPFLAGAGMSAATRGIQDAGVIATAKVSKPVEDIHKSVANGLCSIGCSMSKSTDAIREHLVKVRSSCETINLLFV